jgi:hypothetical protein
MTAKTVLGAAGGAAVVVLVVLCVTWIVDSDTAPAPSRHNRAEGLRGCVTLWNGPANSKQRAVLNTAALAAPRVPPAAPGSAPLAGRVLVLRYSGPPLEDVGVGEAGVNASRGDCVVAHPSQVLFLYTKAAWHQVGYSPGLAFKDIPQQATTSPNAVMLVREPSATPAVNAGKIELAR